MKEGKNSAGLPPVNFSPGQTVGRFRVKSVDNLEEYKSHGILFVEELSGAEIYHVYNNDDENLFSFNFTTLPESSNGVAHILEHTVLCGSERYPIKDPFFTLYKGSMQTFLNAMTFPDKTIYPAASTVKQDLYNLMSVYADAVFFPLLRKEHFLQEGHRLGLGAKAGSTEAAEITGVVYNEMKAHYSTQEAIAREWSCRSLFPDTPYQHDSGGDPAEIPALSYEEFSAFHKTHYHPSNCRIFLYGNISSEEYLDFLDKMIFSRFSPEELKKHSGITVPLQAAWKEPRELELSYPAGREGDSGSSVDLSWLLPEPKSSEDIIRLEILSDILLGSPASPIQKLILETDLGEDMSGSTGLETDLRQPVLTIGMRGTSPERAGQIEKLILSGLERTIEEGLDPDLTLASIRGFEFHSREVKGAMPFGLRLLMRCLKRWLHGDDPASAMRFAPWLEELKQGGNQDLFTGMLREILSSPHRSRVTVRPDPEQNAREEEAERRLVAGKVSALGETALKTLKQEAETFQRFQQEGDRPEDIAKIPFLTVDDIPREIRTIPRYQLELHGCPLHVHELFTNGISYTNFYFDISHIDRELQVFLPFLSHLLPQLGTKTKPYTQMSTEWGLKTGGHSFYVTHHTNISGAQRQYFCIRLKTLDNMSAEGLTLLQEILLEADFSDHRYIREIFNEYRNDFRAGIIPRGSTYADIRARRGLSPQAHTDDLWWGVIQARFIEDLQAEITKTSPARLARLLSSLMGLLFNSSALSLSVVCEEQQSPVLQKQIVTLITEKIQKKPLQQPERPPLSPSMLGEISDTTTKTQVEGIAYSSKINFTALALRASHIEEKEQVHEHILSHVLRTGLFHEKIRVEGGAYGAFCSSNPLTATFSFGTYRDPAISRSWAASEECLRLLAARPLDRQTLDLAKIALAGQELRPYSPAEQGSISFKRFICGISDDLRKRRRTWLIEASGADIQQAARRLCKALPYRAALADPETLKELSAEEPKLKVISMQ